MIIGPLSLLCAGWFFLCWIVAKFFSFVLKGAFSKIIKAGAIVWIVPLVVGVVACAKGV